MLSNYWSRENLL